MAETTPPPSFIRAMVAEDNRTGRFGGRVITRFPPEPNGYLHIGHAKAMSVDFGIAAEHGGRCHLRFDDTNPTKESMEYVESIMADVHWLGFDWGEHLYFASDSSGSTGTPRSSSAGAWPTSTTSRPMRSAPTAGP